MQALPQVLDDRRQRLQVHENTVVQDAAQKMNVTVQQLYACTADIRQCSDVIEGSVLVLGVHTAHTLLTHLSRSLKSIEAVMDAWRTTAAAYQEHFTQCRQLMASMDQAYSGMKERRKTAETELRALRAERDRKEQAYDAAVLYVQRVLAEHTQWQEAHSYNTQRWPMTDTCEEALAVLHAVRAGSSAGNSDRRSRKDGDIGREEVPLPLKDDTSGSVGEVSRSFYASFVSPLPLPALCEWSPVVSSSKANSSEASGDVARRWCTTMGGRLSATQPSLHFAYVPPAEEVQLLREVLAMGTGSSSLMKDIQSAQARLDERRTRVRRVCTRSLDSLHAMRQEMRILRTHLQHLLDSQTPFMSMTEELLSRVRTHMEVEVARRVAAITAPTAMTSTTVLSPTGGSQGGISSTPRLNSSSVSYVAIPSSGLSEVAESGGDTASEGWAWMADA
ncbi:conserved hypothetical protein [Leishmania major strain Friedlin]|uniref:Uncharacterized protein n=1 Tax=Leishmania major TaxID=5664 RepID=E9ACW5_LEIMA|nr:conserved hypothetical protein [Leishmania major strain Friedlin]CAG9576861.1 hypothetical_protein_-_conserved [Leishmania major strain Friedlin]CBZ12318.1 conserved hypothetical protein [Leishmania major strain Friedlin]|eukprot:XP_003722057.1 conserved hypothetical protein [Leishmania major strain Friedlin]